MEWLILITTFLMCCYDYLKNKKLITPIILFNLIWFITIGLYQLKLSTLQQDLSDRTIIIFLVCIISYNVTCLILSLETVKDKIEKLKQKIHGKFKNNKKIIQSGKVRENLNKFCLKNIDDKLIVARFIVIVIFIIEIIYSRGIPLIWKLTGSSKTYFDFGITSLNGAWYGLVICLGAYSLFSNRKDKYLYPIIGVLILSRQIILSIIIEAFVFYMLDKNKKISIKKIIAFFMIAVIVFLGFSFLGNIRSQGKSNIRNVFYAKQEYENIPVSVKWGYSYLTFGINNINNLINMTDGGINHGISSLKSIIPNVILNKINLEVPNKINYLVLSNFNVSTYLPEIYLDFGVCGIIIFNCLIAFLGSMLYQKYEYEYSEKNRLLYSVFAHNIVFLLFTNMFFYFPVIIQFIYIILIFNENKKKCEVDMDNIDLVSVIIPTYNREKTIERAVRSVLNQTYNNIEVLIVDDCSTDNSEKIIDSIKDSRIKYYKLDSNMGACAARNYGIEKAKGDFIAFQDSDDEWYGDKLELQMNYLKENKELDMVFCALNRKKEGSCISTQIPNFNIKNNDNLPYMLLKENFISTQTILAKKYIFEEEKFDTRLPRFQDWDLMIRISKKFNIGYINKALLNLYVQKDSITKNPIKAVKALEIIYDKNKNEIEQNSSLVYQFKKKKVKFLYESNYECKEEIKELLKIKFDLKLFIYYLSIITKTNKIILKIKNR